jgi:hypothetical protein
MTITTEEAELLARISDFNGPTRRGAIIRSLAAERDALKAEVEKSESGVSYETFVSGMQIVTTERDALKAEVERLKAGGCARDQSTTQFCAEAVALQAENVRLREALDFYGDVSKYPAPFTGGMGALWEDCGKIARAAKGETQ